MKALAVVGPTASGKTGLSLALVRHLDAEIVSMDSRQVYRGMDIGTAKVEEGARQAVPHHGLDLVDPDERYSAGHFARDARTWIDGIRSRGRTPLLVGGTGFFLRSLTRPLFREPELDADRREALRRWLAQKPVDALARWVRVLDPERAGLTEAGGRQRMSRAVEVALLTGRPLSRWHREAPASDLPVEVGTVVLQLPREELYRRIDERSSGMFGGGLLEEVRGLLDAGYDQDAPGMSATGYREAAAVLRGELTEEEALTRVQRATRGYARRQLTWFRNQLEEPVLIADAMTPHEELAERILAWWNGIPAGTER